MVSTVVVVVCIINEAEGLSIRGRMEASLYGGVGVPCLTPRKRRPSNVYHTCPARFDPGSVVTPPILAHGNKLIVGQSKKQRLVRAASPIDVRSCLSFSARRTLQRPMATVR